MSAQHIHVTRHDAIFVTKSDQGRVQRCNGSELAHPTQLGHGEIPLSQKVQHGHRAQDHHGQQKHAHDDLGLGHKPQAAHERHAWGQERAKPAHAMPMGIRCVAIGLGWTQKFPPLARMAKASAPGTWVFPRFEPGLRLQIEWVMFSKVDQHKAGHANPTQVHPNINFKGLQPPCPKPVPSARLKQRSPLQSETLPVPLGSCCRRNRLHVVRTIVRAKYNWFCV